MAKVSPFSRILNSINKKTEQVDPDEFKKLGGFVVTRVLSYRKDLVLICNEINKYTPISQQAVYDFYLGVVPKNNRYAGKVVWDTHPKIDIIMEYYTCNKQIATDYLAILSEDDIKLIESRCYKGGKAALKR